MENNLEQIDPEKQVIVDNLNSILKNLNLQTKDDYIGNDDIGRLQVTKAYFKPENDEYLKNMISYLNSLDDMHKSKINYCDLLEANFYIFKLEERLNRAEKKSKTFGTRVGDMMLSSFLSTYSNTSRYTNCINNIIFLLNSGKCDTIGTKNRDDPTKWIIPNTYFSPLIKFLKEIQKEKPEGSIASLDSSALQNIDKMRSNALHSKNSFMATGSSFFKKFGRGGKTRKGKSKSRRSKRHCKRRKTKRHRKH